MIRYPNGKRYERKERVLANRQPTTFSNRGQSLEDELNTTNTFYVASGEAVVHKKPTPIQIVDVHYPKRSAARITEAYFRTPSTTDYNGVWNGWHLDFEAKETKNKTSFPLQNIHDHQVEHMKRVQTHGGIVFFIVKWTTLERYFALFFDDFYPFWQRMLDGGRKSITLQEMERRAYELTLHYQPRLPYLQAVERYVNEKRGNEK